MVTKIIQPLTASNTEKSTSKFESRPPLIPSFHGIENLSNIKIDFPKNQEKSTVKDSQYSASDYGMGKNILLAFASAIGLIGIVIVGSLAIKKRAFDAPFNIVRKNVDLLWKKLFDNITQRQKFHRLSATLISIFINLDHGKTIVQELLLKNIPFLHVLSHDLNNLYAKAVTGSLLSRYKKIDKLVQRVHDYAFEIDNKMLLNKVTAMKEASKPFTDLDIIYDRLDNMEAQIPGVVEKHKNNIASFIKAYTNVKLWLGKGTKEEAAQHLKARSIASDSQVSNERVIRENLKDYRQNLFKLKDKFTYSEKDVIYQLNNLAEELTNSEIFKNNVLHGKFKQVVQQYDKTIFKEEYKPELKKLIQEILKTPHLEYSPAKNARDLLKWLNTDKKGMVQEIKDIIPYVRTLEYSDFLLKGRYLDPYLFRKMEKTLTQIENHTTRAVKFERLNLPGRLLDIGLGPTALWETFATALPLALYAKYVFKPTDPHEKRHQLVKEAPTIVGAVSGAIYGIRKGLYGFEALLFTIIAGIIMRSAGHATDKLYTTYETKKDKHLEKPQSKTSKQHFS